MSLNGSRLKYYATSALSLALILLISLSFFKKTPMPENAVTVSTRDTNEISLFLGSNLPKKVSVSAKSAVLIECGSGKAVFEKNAHVRMPMASTTKIMTALVVIESVDLSDTVTVPREACGIEGSSVYLREGEKFTVEELLYALLLASANDAATALALHTSKSIESFAEEMNELAAELGLRNTHFTNPHGLHDDGHYTTAYELAHIARAAAKNDTFRKITSTQRIIIRRDSKESARLLVNHNRLLRSYDGCFGIKTGFTKASGRCLVSGAERDGVSFIAVTLDAPDDWNDHKALLDAAFSQYQRITLFDAGEIEYMLPIAGSYQTSVLCKSTKAFSVVTDKGTAPNVTYKIYAHRPHFAPISAGKTVGRVVFLINGNIIAECELRSVFSAAKRKK